ncbi:hypothetical protein J0664_05820 [Rhizobium leguminosarum]|uniref:hypothetical protein n=1 Tax=Rhizobium leguminosarum TaxID=384 RepID=UPI001A91F6CA|nr:hypothetical protein [Rhizobium leguminosarum]MBY5553773.1 hypothetical protein [Rhizobium leguminosarum]QSW24817.1 hypothetical protein J0664_05820 [Rhizobium leguminosarum]
MLGRRFIDPEELLVAEAAAIAATAGSVEPFRKPDHKAKRHPKPRNVDCRGRFALRHQKPGRVLAEMGGDE